MDANEVMEAGRLVRAEKVAARAYELLCDGGDSQATAGSLKAFTDAAIAAGWFNEVSAEIDGAVHLPAFAADFLAQAYQLFELGASIETISMSIAEPLAVMGSIIATNAAFEAMLSLYVAASEQADAADDPEG